MGYFRFILATALSVLSVYSSSAQETNRFPVIPPLEVEIPIDQQFAVLIQASHEDEMLRTLSFAYRTLLKKGIPKNNIYVVNTATNLNADLDGDKKPETAVEFSAEALEKVYKGIGDRTTRDPKHSQVMTYLFTHGRYNNDKEDSEFGYLPNAPIPVLNFIPLLNIINVVRAQPKLNMGAKEFAEIRWRNLHPETMDILVAETCYAGGHADACQSPRHVVITASDKWHVAWGGSEGLTRADLKVPGESYGFTGYHLFSALGGEWPDGSVRTVKSEDNASLGEAYTAMRQQPGTGEVVELPLAIKIVETIFNFGADDVGASNPQFSTGYQAGVWDAGIGKGAVMKELFPRKLSREKFSSFPVYRYVGQNDLYLSRIHFRLGDSNENGVIDDADIEKLKAALAGRGELTLLDTQIFDVNPDGILNRSDLQLLIDEKGKTLNSGTFNELDVAITLKLGPDTRATGGVHLILDMGDGATDQSPGVIMPKAFLKLERNENIIRLRLLDYVRDRYEGVADKARLKKLGEDLKALVSAIQACAIEGITKLECQGDAGQVLSQLLKALSADRSRPRAVDLFGGVAERGACVRTGENELLARLGLGRVNCCQESCIVDLLPAPKFAFFESANWTSTGVSSALPVVSQSTAPSSSAK